LPLLHPQSADPADYGKSAPNPPYKNYNAIALVLPQGKREQKNLNLSAKGQYQQMYAKKFNAGLTIFQGTQGRLPTVSPCEIRRCTKVPVCPGIAAVHLL